ncbi:hypothetical protein [Chelativorans intermedius]|uniref:Uncharacterized protein n=1 Tax=Chelativorans intermedius TaxID=515947 RepID=A0ABV6DBB2_9HYPH|nr:hypothetical protein [Chelativorans intermedius]MCT9000286.1 hypothetical protein [Chelativorans intermedius]
METVPECSTWHPGHGHVTLVAAIAAARQRLVGRRFHSGMGVCHLVRLTLGHTHAAPEDEEQQSSKDAADGFHDFAI